MNNSYIKGQTTKLLKKAKQVLVEYKWTRGGVAKKANGHTSCSTLHKDAACFCALGAVFRAAGIDTQNSYTQKAENNLVVRNALVRLAQFMPDKAYENITHLVHANNDYHVQSKAQILKIFDKAIEGKV